MHGDRSSRGIPVPSVWQLLVVGAAVCAGWLIWSEFRGMGSGSSVKEGAGEVTAEASLNTLRSIEALDKRGAEGIPELVKSLDDPNPKVRRYALLVLRRLGPLASEALDPIRERLTDEDDQVREFAMDAYWHIRRDSDAVGRVVVERLGDDEQRVRTAAAKLLVQIGPSAIPLVVAMLRRESAAVRITALKVLRSVGWDESRPEVDEALRGLASDEDSNIRAAALATLAQWGQPLSGELRELLAQSPGIKVSVPFGPNGEYYDVAPQQMAMSAIVRLGPDAVENLPDVLAFFDMKPDRWYTHPRMALPALRSMKSAALPAAPRLFELFDESEGSYHTEIGWTLIEVGADRQEIVGRLIPLLTCSDMDDCRSAGRLLAYASPDVGRRQVTELIPKLSPDQFAQHRSALHAISGLARVAHEAVPSLTILLQQPLVDYDFWRVIDTLGDIGSDAAPAVPVLVELLDRDPATLKISHRLAIIGSLARVGSAARPAIPALLSELRTIKTQHTSTPADKWEQAHCLSMAISALTIIGGKDPEVLAALRTQLTSDDADASGAALGALLQLSPESPDLLAELLNRRLRSNYSGRDGWIFAITRMTCDRQEAIGPLTEALRGAAPETRKLAAWALGTLGSDARAALPALYDALLDWENSLYKPRSSIRGSLDNSMWNDLLGWSNRSTIWRSVFEMGFEELFQFEKSSVRDVVREAILKIDPAADVQDGIQPNDDSRQR